MNVSPRAYGANLVCVPHALPASLTCPVENPVNRNGKRIARRCPIPRPRSRAVPPPSRTKVERAVAQVWAQAFGVEKAG